MVRLAKRALLSRLLDTGEGTADDICDVVQLPDGIHPNVFGSVPGELARAGIIVVAGYCNSRRPEANANLLRAWRLRDRQAAIAWLAAHPPLHAPETTEGAAASTAAPSKQKSLF